MSEMNQGSMMSPPRGPDLRRLAVPAVWVVGTAVVLLAAAGLVVVAPAAWAALAEHVDLQTVGIGSVWGILAAGSIWRGADPRLRPDGTAREAGWNPRYALRRTSLYCAAVAGGAVLASFGAAAIFGLGPQWFGASPSAAMADLAALLIGADIPISIAGLIAPNRPDWANRVPQEPKSL